MNCGFTLILTIGTRVRHALGELTVHSQRLAPEDKSASLMPDRAAFAASGVGFQPTCFRQAAEVAEP
jgi:hypothetical protein